jgi:hypothetical protein
MPTNLRKSGNGTRNSQWLYLYLNFPLVFLVKIGISGNYKRRARQVAKQGFGKPIPVFAVKIPFAWDCEQAMHRWFSWFRVRYGGSKEWYWFPIAPLAMLVMLVALVVEWLVLCLLVVAILWWLKHGAN